MTILLGLGACASGNQSGRTPSSLAVSEGCREVAQNLIESLPRITPTERGILLQEPLAAEIAADPVIKNYFEYVSDPEERADFIALLVKVRAREGDLYGTELLSHLDELTSRPCP